MLILLASTQVIMGQTDSGVSEKDPADNQRTPLPTSYWPADVEFDENIPTPKEFFGFGVGVRHLSHAQVAGYAKEIAKTSDRVSIQQYGKTHGGRPLLLLTVTGGKNRENLEAIQQASRQLTKPNGAKVDTDGLPAVINMGYGVHGDEPSATNCSPLVMHYLAAAKGEEIEQWLENCVILIDPSLNPDGFNRFANWANRYRGSVPNPDPQHAEHDQQWPPGRVNYYWFDLNRDWLPLVHPESRGRMNWFHKWKPNVVLDFHEMGTNSSYFFQPGIPERTNPLTPAKNIELTRAFAGYHGKALDDKGSLYFTQERFDDFYMGKGSTYPDLHGSVGILFEQASSRGHVQRNQDGLLKFHDTISNQFTTSLSSLRATSDMRDQLIDYKKSFYETSLGEANKQAIKTYVFTCKNNRNRIEEFSRVLLRHDIQCYWLKDDFEYGDRTFEAASSLVVPTEQAEFKFLKSLLMRRTSFRENIFYDVSSWTLPLAYGVDQKGLKKRIPKEKLELAKLVRADRDEQKLASADHVAFLVDWRNDAAPKLLFKLLRAGIKVRVAKKPFSIASKSGSKKFGYGTLSVVLGIQEEKSTKILQILNEGITMGASITPVDSGLSTSGPDMGSGNFAVIKKPEIAMISGPGVSNYGAGEIWHLLDFQHKTPVTMLKRSRFSRVDLGDYTSLVLPGGSLDADEWDAASKYVSNGGTVIAFGRAAIGVASRLSATQSSPASDKAKPEIQKPFDSSSDERALKLISGAIFKTRIDPTNPLMFGFSKKPLAVFRNHASFLEPSSNPYANPMIYDAENPLMAGYCSDENVERFKGSASVVVRPQGKGRFILMAENPNFRGFWKATSRVFLNAVFFGDQADP